MSRTPRRLILLGSPLSLGLLEVFHPNGQELYATVADNVRLWLTVHLLQLPLFGLVAVAVCLLPSGLAGKAAILSRIGMWFFIVFYTALDSIAGIASGVLVAQAQDLPADRQQLIAQQVDAFSANFSAPLADGGGPAFIVTLLGGLGWIVGLVAAAIAVRSSGAPMGVAILVGLGAIFVVHDAPFAPVAMLFLLAAAAWIEFFPGSAQAAPSTDPTRPRKRG